VIGCRSRPCKTAARCAFSNPPAKLWIFKDRQMSRLENYYKETVVPQLQEKFSYSNIMEVPRLTKITLNMGVGEAVGDKKVMDRAVGDMTAIAGQKPIVTYARKSVASFKIRDGWPVGCKVTLRRERMYEFMDRLVNVAIPRIRDFRGLNRRSFDGKGNYSMGVKEQIMFPEIDYDQIDVIRGMDITITTTAKTDEEAMALMQAFNFPFRER
jgi:large subunit ribosomal protein L5